MERIKFRRRLVGEEEGGGLVGEGCARELSFFLVGACPTKKKIHVQQNLSFFILVVRGHSLWLAWFLEKNVLSSILKFQS